MLGSNSKMGVIHKSIPEAFDYLSREGIQKGDPS
jgi:hypothetical protein